MEQEYKFFIVDPWTHKIEYLSVDALPPQSDKTDFVSVETNGLPIENAKILSDGDKFWAEPIDPSLVPVEKRSFWSYLWPFGS